ncbi:c-type cytochrome biogenesis protein CcsB [Pilimelia columellifera]
MSALSDQLLIVTIVGYLAAMIGHAAEYALGQAHAAVGARPGVRQRAPEAAPVGAPSGVQGPPVSDLPDPPASPPGPPAGRYDGPAPATSRAAVYAGRAAIGATMAAAVAHLACLVTRAIAAGRPPWGNLYEFELSVTFVGVVVWLVVLARQPRLRQLGLFVSLAMVLLIGAAGLIAYTEIKPLMPALQSSWYVVHVSTIVIASGLFLFGAVPAVMFLVREGHERGLRSFPYSLGPRVPAAAGLERLTFRMHAFAFPLFTFGVAAGAIWAEAAWGRYWGWDPKETWSFISWVVYAGYLHARATPYIKRRTAVWLAVLGFATMLMNLFGVNLFVSGLHSYADV